MDRYQAMATFICVVDTGSFSAAARQLGLGQNFYERARNAIQEADEAELAAKGAGAGLSDRLRVSAATTFARLHIIPELPQFLEDHPQLTVEIILDNRMIDLVAEGVDISLRMGTLTDSTAIARKIATGRRSVLATPSYLKRAAAPSLRRIWRTMRRSFTASCQAPGRSCEKVPQCRSLSAGDLRSVPQKGSVPPFWRIWA
ncbi:LysR family transcriptional regulator [Gluconobacter sp. P5E10]|uniref:LysR family transcriptional regulator n=1 Tax=Gluconobacter sp. P5E10 TaxID=2762613 RepID=UPI002012D761